MHYSCFIPLFWWVEFEIAPLFIDRIVLNPNVYWLNPQRLMVDIPEIGLVFMAIFAVLVAEIPKSLHCSPSQHASCRVTFRFRLSRTSPSTDRDKRPHLGRCRPWEVMRYHHPKRRGETTELHFKVSFGGAQLGFLPKDRPQPKTQKGVLISRMPVELRSHRIYRK